MEECFGDWTNEVYFGELPISKRKKNFDFDQGTNH
mgnify:FL=1